MPDTVSVTIEVEPEVAAALTRARLERLIRRTLRPDQRNSASRTLSL